MKFPDDDEKKSLQSQAVEMLEAMAPELRVKELVGPVVMAMEMGEENGFLPFQVAKSLLHYVMIRHRFSFTRCLETLAEIELVTGKPDDELIDFYRKMTEPDTEI